MISCKNQQHDHHTQSNASKSPLYDEVMEIHDAVMPEMSTIHKLKKELKAIENPDTKSIILNKIKELNNADEAMMTWMAEFKNPADPTTATPYLTAEKVKIKGVSDQMYAAIATATSLLDSLKSIPQ